MELIIATERKRQVLDITDRIEAKLQHASGMCALNLLHTTAALATADLDPGSDQDLLDALDAMAPNITFRHPHDPKHFPDHLWSTLLGTSLAIPVSNGKLMLGTWQRVILVEFDGPRERMVAMTLVPANVSP